MAVFDIFKRLVNQNAAPGERRAEDRLRASLGARVLVVDDSATIRAVLGKMLVQDGYEVLKAADGESAVEMAQSQFPDLIFLDIVLPGVSGFAVLRSLRRDTRTHNTPIIMMSGNQQATEQFYVQRFGADGFIKKPFGRAEVFHAIRSLVQAGRIAARTQAPPVEAIPDGMTAEEWNAIPDVALPDEDHVTSPAAVAQVSPWQSEPSRQDAAASAPAQPSAQPEIPSPGPLRPADPESLANAVASSVSAVPAVETRDRAPEAPLAAHSKPSPSATPAVTPSLPTFGEPHTRPARAIPFNAFSLAMRPTLGRIASMKRAGTPPVTVHVRRPEASHQDSTEDDGEATPDPRRM